MERPPRPQKYTAPVMMGAHESPGSAYLKKHLSLPDLPTSDEMACVSTSLVSSASSPRSPPTPPPPSLPFPAAASGVTSTAPSMPSRRSPLRQVPISAPTFVPSSGYAAAGRAGGNGLTPAPRLPETRRQLYLYHEQVVTALAGKDRAYAAARERAAESAEAAGDAARDLEIVQATERQLQEQLDTLQRNRVRRTFFPSKTADGIGRLEQRLATVAAEVLVARRRATRLTKRAKIDDTRAQALHGDAQLLHASNQARQHILSDIASTNSVPAFTREPRIHFCTRPITNNYADASVSNNSIGGHVFIGKRYSGDRKPHTNNVDERRNADDDDEDEDDGDYNDVDGCKAVKDRGRSDRLASVTRSAQDSLSAQQEARRLLVKARTILKEVRRRLWDVFISTNAEGTTLKSMYADGVVHSNEYTPVTKTNNQDKKSVKWKKEGDGNGNQDTVRKHNGYDKLILSNFEEDQYMSYEFKWASWQSREAGKHIERAIVLANELPIEKLVRSWFQQSSFLDLSPVLQIHQTPTVCVIRIVVERAARIVDSVCDVLKESIDLQDGVIDVLRDKLRDHNHHHHHQQQHDTDFDPACYLGETKQQMRMRSDLAHRLHIST